MTIKPVYTSALLPNQTIGICAPSSSIDTERFDKGLSILTQRGFKTVIHPQTYCGAGSGNQLSGTPEQKAEALTDLWTNPEVDIVMAACGGNFSALMLDLLDYDLLAKTPKPLIGFSDTTALLSAIYCKTGIGGIFGPTVQTLGKIENLDLVFDMLAGKSRSSIEFSNELSGAAPENIGPAPVYAATLSVLMSLAGTPYFPDLSGHILILEDNGEELSRLNRMLWQLDRICPFDRLAGLIFGEFVDTVDTGRPLGLSFHDIIRQYTQDRFIPVGIQAPIGHGTRFLPVPLVQRASWETSSTSNQTARLIFP